MKFMITGSEPRGEWQRLDAEEMNRRVRGHQRILEELAAAHAAARVAGLIFASIGLGAEHEAVTVRHVESRTVTVDGPFPETKEVVGGFDIVEFDSPRAAVEWTAATERHASHVAHVRPIVEFSWLSGVVDLARLMQVERWPDSPPRHAAADTPMFLLTAVEDEGMDAVPPECANRRLQRRLPVEYIRERSATHQPGLWLGARLGPIAEARAVRRSGGKPVVSEVAGAGPTVVAVNVLACASQEEAIAWARRLAPQAGQSVEIRPVRACWWLYRG